MQEYIPAAPSQNQPLPRTKDPTPHVVWVGRNQVPQPTPLDRLHAEYAELDRQDPSRLTPDQRRSLIYYHYELELKLRTPSDSPAPVHVANWFAGLISLENFVALERRWPRENNRAEAAEFSDEEKRLATWVRTQRSAIDQGRRCDYQIKRLSFIAGFRHRPLQDRWNHRLLEFHHFTDTHHRAPLLRSTDFMERSLAAWAAKQRFAYRNRTLSCRRIETLQRLSYWSWGPRRTRY